MIELIGKTMMSAPQKLERFATSLAKTIVMAEIKTFIMLSIREIIFRSICLTHKNFFRKRTGYN